MEKLCVANKPHVFAMGFCQLRQLLWVRGEFPLGPLLLLLLLGLIPHLGALVSNPGREA